MKENFANERGDTNLNASPLPQLRSQDWGNISKRLLLYAIKRAQRYGWIDSETKIFAGGDFTVDDIVQEVVMKTLSGEWNWDSSKYPLFTWLKHRINSVMDHWINSKFRKHEIPFADEDLNEEAGEKSNSIAIEDAEDLYATEPEVELLHGESRQNASITVKLLFESITGDLELEALVDYVMNTGETRPRFVAKSLGTTVENVNNRKKRLYRHLQGLKTKNERLSNEQEAPNRN